MTDSVAIGRVDQRPFFEPWIGEAYASRLAAVDADEFPEGGLWRCHVMGESHYSEEAAYPGMTISAVQSLALAQNRGSGFWTRVLTAVEGQPVWQIDREKAWSDLAFSEFVQDVLPDKRTPPTSEMWERGRQCFFAQLAVTRPTILVVLGRTFEHLPNEGFRCPALQTRLDWGPVTDAWAYPYEVEGRFEFTLAVRIVHPAGGMNAQVAHNRIATVAGSYSSMAIYAQELRENGWKISKTS